MSKMIFRSPGDVIAKIRRDRELDDVELAHESGMKVGKLRDIESGTPPSEDELQRIADSLDINPKAIKFIAGDIPSKVQEQMIENPESVFEALTNQIDWESEENPSTKLNKVFSTELGNLYKGDCLEVLPELEDESFDMIFCDPPFNLDKDYGNNGDDDLPDYEYLKWCTEWIDECIRLLKPGGSFYLYNLPKWNIHLANYISQKLNLRHWITIDIKFGLPRPNQFYPSHYSLLYFTKGKKPSTFEPPRQPIETCPHCGGEQSDYGGYKSKMNPEGRNLTDVWDDIPPVRHSKYLDRDANQLSVKLLHRVISTSTEEGDKVLDPFMGAGTTASVSEIHNREWTGVELNDCQPIIDRLNDLETDKERIKEIEEHEDVLFTEEALKLRQEYKEEFGFNFEDYDLSKSPTSAVQTSINDIRDNE